MTRLTTITLPAPAARMSPVLPVWMPVVLALLTLYVPTYSDIARVFWSTEQGAPGVVVIALWFWLLWRERALLRIERRTRAGSLAGWTAILLGAVVYALGRSQQMFQLEAGSQLLILPGIALVLLGPFSARRLWFVWLFLALTVPLPGSLVDALLVPLKDLVAATVTELLYLAGVPVARDGVVIYAGPYQLFIADACSGLNQLVALTAVGLLYVRVAGHTSRARNSLLLGAVVPVAIAANLVRVMTLVLATYYGGDDLGRRLHDGVSFVEIALAFGAFLAIDRLADLVARARRSA
jgi:exosortase